MTKFEASNAVEVHYRTNERGVSVGSHPNGYDVTPGHDIDVEQTDALRDFFQRERDEERGWWRPTSDPTWTAVRRNNVVYFQNEDHERSFHFVPRIEASIKAWATVLQAFAYEYIDAHPELKPWKAAKPGEVWVLTVDGREDAYVDRDGDFHPIRPSVVVSIAHDYSRITEGRRIWPEDAS